jgi:hypothetical protein
MMMSLLLLVCTALVHQNVLRHDGESSTIDRAHPGKIRRSVRHIRRIMVEGLNEFMVGAHVKALERRRQIVSIGHLIVARVLARVRALVLLVMMLIYGESLKTNMFMFICIIVSGGSVVWAEGIGINIRAKPITNRREEAFIRRVDHLCNYSFGSWCDGLGPSPMGNAA